MLNRTVRTLSAANLGLNLGTRSTANAVVVNGKTLRNRPTLLGMHDHPMRDEIKDFPGKPTSSISGSPSIPVARPSSGFAWPARSVAVAEAPEATPQVADNDPRCEARPGQQRQDQETRQSPRLSRSYRRPGLDLRLPSPTARRLLAARKGLALG